jgi:hypothetical protein
MKHIFFLFFIINLTSCKKQTITISAINPVTGKNVPNLRYEILSEKTGFNGEKYKKVAEGSLNKTAWHF